MTRTSVLVCQLRLFKERLGVLAAACPARGGVKNSPKSRPTRRMWESGTSISDRRVELGLELSAIVDTGSDGATDGILIPQDSARTQNAPTATFIAWRTSLSRVRTIDQRFVGRNLIFGSLN